MNFGHIGDIQETVDHLIAEVNNGDLKALAYIAVHDNDDGTVSYGWSGGRVKLELMGAIDVLKYALVETFEKVEPEGGEIDG